MNLTPPFLSLQITFQVKRVKKPKTDTSEGWVGDGDVRQSESTSSNSILEISGPTIPSPGPSGAENELRML